MDVYEIRDPAQARRHLLTGLVMTRTAVVDAHFAQRALTWTLELAARGDPLPPVGFVADVGQIALGLEIDPTLRDGLPVVSGFDRGLVRRYDDYVLGKFYVDQSFERGADALFRYHGRDQVRALAFFIERLRQRAGFGGALLSPAVIRTLLHAPPENLLSEAWETVEQEGVSQSLVDDYEELTSAIHNLGETLGVEDVFELEHGTALVDFGQRVALRQILQAAEELVQQLPRYKPRPSMRRRYVATNILDEDAYPVGGFSSISNRGAIESLLHSQLAYMEQDQRPDLFDVKFLRDELLYYARDENHFLRRRQTFIFALYPDLAQVRFKDAALPWQRIVLVLASLLAAVRKWGEWFSEDALLFEILILDRNQLAPEEELLRTLFRDQVQSGYVRIERAEPISLPPRCNDYARYGHCHYLGASLTPHEPPSERVFAAQLLPTAAIPQFFLDQEPVNLRNETPLDAWRRFLDRWLSTSIP